MITMKNTLFTTFLFLFVNGLFAQEVSVPEPSMKFGKPSDEEISMTTYTPDTTASAVVLCKKLEVYYTFAAQDFQVNYEYETKIKVLKSDGTDYANVSIPYYDNIESSLIKEAVVQIDACAYNLEGGKVERTKMKKEFIFKERLNDQYVQLKFSIPNVKVGTVIEYKYKILSDLYYDLRDWSAQQSIPTLYTEYNITLPEYFKFSIDSRGTEQLESKEQTENVSFTIGGQILQCGGRNLRFKGHQLSALRDDNYIWCADDYATQVNFELSGIDFPGTFSKSFSHTWEDIDKALLNDQDFGGRLKMHNPFQEEMKSLQLDQMNNNQEKIATVYMFLKQRIKWDGTYSLYGGKARKIVKDGTANNAEINFILMSMLRDAGIHSYPVVMSRRDRGVIPYSHPSIQKLNTFVVAIADTDSTMVFLDGSVNTGYLNTLPPVLMVNRARMISPGLNGKWIDLSQLGKSQLRSIVNATLLPDGKISGTRTTNYKGQYAATFRDQYHAAKDSTEFIDKLATKENIQVTGMQMEGINLFSPNVKETVQFEKQISTNDHFIYLNPLVFLHVEKNPFTQTERKLPVEYSFAEQINLSISLALPEGYVVDEMPQPLQIKTSDGGATCRYNLAVENNRLTVTYFFVSNKLLYLPSEYSELQNFWRVVTEKNNEMIVLKKL